jgi:Domain of unknown function (DUF4395)
VGGVAKRLFSFPNPVNETAARVVAGGVVAVSAIELATGQHWLLIPLAYGFLARALTGPTLSPLGQFATRVAAPRLPARPVPGPPKRFAQAIGATFSGAALVAWIAGVPTAADVLVGLLIVAATLESGFGICLGCKAFALLMRVGVHPRAHLPRVRRHLRTHQPRANDFSSSALPRGSRSRVKHPNETSKPRFHS